MIRIDLNNFQREREKCMVIHLFRWKIIHDIDMAHVSTKFMNRRQKNAVGKDWQVTGLSRIGINLLIWIFNVFKVTYLKYNRFWIGFRNTTQLYVSRVTENLQWPSLTFGKKSPLHFCNIPKIIPKESDMIISKSWAPTIHE